MSLTKHKKHLMRGLAGFGIVAAAALVWFTLHGPERARNPLAVSMETDSAAFFATERDLTALAQDVRAGSAAGIGLSSEYALVSRRDGTRYYVHMDTQRAVVTELVKLAQTEGAVRPDLDPATAARLLLGMVNSLTEWYRPRPGGAQALADTVAEMAFQGLRT